MIKLIDADIICDRCGNADETGFSIDGECVCNDCVTERELDYFRPFKLKLHSKLEILIGVILVISAILFFIESNWLMGIVDIILGMVYINFGVGEQ